MSLRGAVEDFPLETVLQLLAATGKTGELAVRGGREAGVLGMSEGRLVSARYDDESGETALGAILTIRSGEFAFSPTEGYEAHDLSGDLDSLLDRAVQERDRLIEVREVIPNDHVRFSLSERAAADMQITLTSDQWRALLAAQTGKDVAAIAQHLGMGRLPTSVLLFGLVRSGLLDVSAVSEAPPEPDRSGPAAPPRSGGEASSGGSWAAGPSVERVESWSAAAVAEPEPPSVTEPESPSVAQPEAWAVAAPAVEAAPEPAVPDERLSALGMSFDTTAASAPPAAWEAPAATESPQWQSAPTAEAAPAWEAPPEIDPRLAAFGLAAGSALAPEAAPVPPPPEPLGPPEPTRPGRLAAFANALVAEYNSGRLGKERIEGRMSDLLLRADELADPIDRPLPVKDDRIDVETVDRRSLPEPQGLAYISTLIRQIYEDAERALGKDKAKRGFRDARDRLFGSDLSLFRTPEVAGRLPKI